MKVVDYVVIQADTPDYLEKKVKKKIEEGYIPQGGIGVISVFDIEISDGWGSGNSGIGFVQAMVKYEKDKEK